MRRALLQTLQMASLPATRNQILLALRAGGKPLVRPFGVDRCRTQVRNLSASYRQQLQLGTDRLPPRIPVTFKEVDDSELLCLKWERPPRNILLIKKDCSSKTTDALTDFANHVQSTYPDINILLESNVADELSNDLAFDVHTVSSSRSDRPNLSSKVDLIATFGGDGTILHAASLFAATSNVPPMLSFSMGTLGFLGEWRFDEYKRAFREAYMSGSDTERSPILSDKHPPDDTSNSDRTGWSSIRGKSMGSARAARILVRQRLRVSVHDAAGNKVSSNGDPTADVHAMNEVILHRGKNPHLTILEVYVGGRFLTEAVADGMIVSTPTGSTAYSLSSGGSIIHPLVSSLLLTPVCPRSLSFRPLILPATTPIKLRVSEKNRGREVEVSIDGIRRSHGIHVGSELHVSGEEIDRSRGHWQGGIPCIMRRSRAGTDSDDGWVGGLNSLLKFNYPFGEQN